MPKEQEVKTAPIFAASSSEELSALFSSFSKSAFRLELFQTYLVEEEADEFSEFIKDHQIRVPSRDMISWCEMIRAATAKSKTFQRVRRITVPLSDYTRFEIITGYRLTIDAGEDIRIFQSDAISCFNEDVPFLTDFWLFDDSCCILLDYDTNGHYLGARKVAEEYLQSYLSLKKEALNISERIKDSTIWNNTDN